ncbi:hypothetical protein S7711_11156 [Stachybotrys chartarum IBT 7711]|uniref:Uncharacterized protein n=1 Tax=Stachybotrys chartarum (strain CBS 109288 / IBT 7711) TaxID=1280523 RepID=A0A084B7E3_STACB|nr:hypothetical protein S7711_11156 [Stachybotrys chartarum IBT 7711]KFA50021.1 hypothetical protein S40293_11015 [Stachybotrys chartarum IBT 40293]
MNDRSPETGETTNDAESQPVSSHGDYVPDVEYVKVDDLEDILHTANDLNSYNSTESIGDANEEIDQQGLSEDDAARIATRHHCDQVWEVWRNAVANGWQLTYVDVQYISVAANMIWYNRVLRERRLKWTHFEILRVCRRYYPEDDLPWSLLADCVRQRMEAEYDRARRNLPEEQPLHHLTPELLDELNSTVRGFRDENLRIEQLRQKANQVMESLGEPQKQHMLDQNGTYDQSISIQTPQSGTVNGYSLYLSESPAIMSPVNPRDYGIPRPQRNNPGNSTNPGTVSSLSQFHAQPSATPNPQCDDNGAIPSSGAGPGTSHGGFDHGLIDPNLIQLDIDPANAYDPSIFWDIDPTVPNAELAPIPMDAPGSGWTADTSQSSNTSTDSDDAGRLEICKKCHRLLAAQRAWTFRRCHECLDRPSVQLQQEETNEEEATEQEVERAESAESSAESDIYNA